MHAALPGKQLQLYILSCRMLYVREWSIIVTHFLKRHALPIQPGTSHLGRRIST